MCFIFISVIDVVAVVFEMEKKLVWKKKKILSVNTQQLVNSPHIFKGAAQFRTS